MLRVSGPHVDLKRVDVRRLNPLNQLASFITEKSRYEPSQLVNTVKSQHLAAAGVPRAPG